MIVVCCLLCVFYYMLFGVWCFDVCCFLIVVRCMLCVACFGVLFFVRWVLFVVSCKVFVVCRLTCRVLALVVG